VNVAVIATVRNERASIYEFVDSLVSQTLPASDIVIADAASDDGTREALDELAARHRALRVIDYPGDRSAGRNAAINAARHDVIACIDAGCVAEPDWLENLTAPFSSDAEWVAGFYRPLGRSLLSTCIGLVMVWTLDEVDPDNFMPSARSMAFLRSAWERVGGFPEGLQFAEDTIFDERLLAAGLTPVFAGDAIVRWTPPATLRQLAVTAFRWGRGDGQTRNSRFYPKRRLAIWAGTPVAAITVAAVAWPLVPIAVLPLGVAVARGTQRKYSSVRGPLKYLFIPLAFLVNGFAAVTGYVVGRFSPP
jgi:cellulose synthase/poly-beta-1,6-N-acetylglucosamine synthase-like glycosyltransferase